MDVQHWLLHIYQKIPFFLNYFVSRKLQSTCYILQCLYLTYLTWKSAQNFGHMIVVTFQICRVNTLLITICILLQYVTYQPLRILIRIGQRPKRIVPALVVTDEICRKRARPTLPKLIKCILREVKGRTTECKKHLI